MSVLVATHTRITVVIAEDKDEDKDEEGVWVVVFTVK